MGLSQPGFLLPLALALVTLNVAAPGAQAAVGDAAALLHGANAAAGQAAHDAAALASGAGQQVTGVLVLAASQAAAAGNQAAGQALGLAASAPGMVMPTVWRYYDNAEEVPPLLQDFVEQQTGRLDDLDAPILWDANGTFQPYMQEVAAGIQVEFHLDAPIGTLPSGGIGASPPYVPEPAELAQDTQDFALRSAAHAAAWTLETADEAQAFAPVLVDTLTG